MIVGFTTTYAISATDVVSSNLDQGKVYNIMSTLVHPHFYTPRNEVVGGYTGFTMSVRLSVDKSYVVR
jgi:hypothetical protein